MDSVKWGDSYAHNSHSTKRKQPEYDEAPSLQDAYGDPGNLIHLGPQAPRAETGMSHFEEAFTEKKHFIHRNSKSRIGTEVQ